MNRAQMINSLEDIIDMVKTSNEKEFEPVYFIPSAEDISQDEKAENEYDKLGFFVSFHPLDNYRIKLSSMPTIQDLEDKISGEMVVLGGLVMDAVEKTTKKGTKMGVFTLEDLTGRLEVVVFGRTFNEFKPFLSMKNPAVQIAGKLEITERELDDGEVIRTPKVMLSKIKLLEESQKIDKLTINLTKNDNLQAIYKLVSENPGDIKINLEYELAVFHTSLTLIQDAEVLKDLGRLCHYETFLVQKEN